MLDQITREADRAAVEPDAGAEVSADTDRRLTARWALGTVALVSAVRLGYAANRTVVSTFPDEPAQLAIARWLSGGTRWSMLDHSTWQPGYSVVLIPAYWVTDNPETVYRCALAIGSLLGGVGALLLARLLLRVTSIDVRTATWTAVFIAVLPAGLAASARAWAEPLVTVIVLGLVLLALRAVEEGSVHLGVALVAVAGAGHLVHGRLLPLLPIALSVLIVVLVRRDRYVLIVPAALLTAAVFAVVEFFSAWVRRNVWTGPDQTDTVGSTLERLTNPGALVDSMIGQTS